MNQFSIPGLKAIISIEGGIAAGKSTIINYLKKNYKKIHDTDLIYVEEPVAWWTSDQRIPDDWLELITDDMIEEIPSNFISQDSIKKYPPILKGFLNMFYEDIVMTNGKMTTIIFQIYVISTIILSYHLSISDLIDNRIKRGIPTDKPFIMIVERSAYTSRNVFTKLNSDSIPLYLLPAYEIIYQSLILPFKEYHKYMIAILVDLEVAIERKKKRSREAESNIPVEYMKRLNEQYLKTYNQFIEEDGIVHYINWNNSFKKGIRSFSSLFLYLIQDIID